MPTGGAAQKRYTQNRQYQQRARFQAANTPTAGSAAGSKTAGRIKGGDLFNRANSAPENLANQKQKGVAGAKTAGRIKGEDLTKKAQPDNVIQGPWPARQSQPVQQAESSVEEQAQQEAVKTTPEDVANRTARAAASTVETGAATVEKGAQAAEGAAAVAQGAAKGTEAAAKGAQVAAKGIGAASQAAGAASKGVMSAGQALSSTGLGAIVGVPLMALGGAGSAASAGGKAAAKGGEVAAKGVEKGAKAAGEGAKKVKEGAKKVKEGAKNVKEQAGQAKDGLDQMHKENKDGKFAQASGKTNGSSLERKHPTRRRKYLAQMRQMVKDQGGSRTEFELGRKEAGISDPDLSKELLRSSRDPAKDLFDQAEINTKRKAALYGSRLADKLGAHKLAKGLGEGSRQQLGNNANNDQSQAPGRSGQRDSIRERLASQIQAKQLQKQEADAEKKKEGEGDSQQEEIKKNIKAGMRRGIVYLVDLLAAGLDMSTGGLSFFVDIFMYGFSLGWLNLEMFYGFHLAKGKSRYISPISWAPFKIPVDEKAYMLQAAILTADLALFTALAVITFGGFCFMHDYLKLLVTPIDFAAAVLAGGDGLCFGAILSSALTGL